MVTDKDRRKALSLLEKHKADLISRFVKSLEKVDDGKAQPTTEAQNHFLSVCRGECNPKTEIEKAYLSYKKLLTNIEASKPRPKYLRGGGLGFPSSKDKSAIPEYEEGSPRPGFKPLNKYE